MNKELERLERDDIIENVPGEPTHWLNPLVIVPKGDKGEYSSLYRYERNQQGNYLNLIFYTNS